MLDCIFCKIAQKKISSNIIYEDDKVVAFKDLDPKAPVHILIIPKDHISSANDLDSQNSSVVAHIFLVAKKIAADKNLVDGYRIVNNCGEQGGQTVNHIHFHLLGGRSMKWPPG